MTRFAYRVLGDPPVWQGQGFAIKRVRDSHTEHRNQATLARPLDWTLDRRYSVLVSAYVRTARAAADISDLGKFVLDALQGIAFANDSQVTSLVVEREIDDEEPRTWVRVIPQREGV